MAEREFHSEDPTAWDQASTILDAIDASQEVFDAFVAEERTAKGEALAAAVAGILRLRVRDTKRQLAVLRAHLDNPDERVRVVALENVWYRGETDAQWKRLSSAVRDPSERVRVAALRSMGSADKQVAEARKHLQAVLDDKRASAVLCEVATEALKDLNDRAAERAKYNA